MNLTKDALALVRALALTKVHGVVGHDFGSPVAAWCALIRPDVFGSVALMSAPFGGPPALPRGGQPAPSDMHEALAQLDRPRKHYQWYYTTPEANDDMLRCPQGVHDFLRAYYHHKSADWRGNKPYPLSAWSAPQLALMPTYYVMDKGETMATTVAAHMPTTQQIAACKWLTDEELSTYSSEYQRNGFQGGLQWYRCSTDVKRSADFQLFAGMTIDVPSCFIAGSSDWGVHQRPGAFETMQGSACTDMRAVHSLDGAGHWVQQEQPERVAGALLDFFAKLDS
jgi:pimeloyl-ACP methyl ester carboxylesterase